MNPFRPRPAAYTARRSPEGWVVSADGDPIAVVQKYHQAVDTAAVHHRRRRRTRATLAHLGVILMAVVALALVIETREVDNPSYPGARDLADRMEIAYRAVDAGEAAIGSFTLEGDGLSGGEFEVDVTGVVNDYNVLVGPYEDDCYVMRWVRFEVPFVGRLLPRFECVPGGATLNFSSTAWEAIAPNVTSSGGLEWFPVIPDPVRLAPWFFPGALVLLTLILQQSISISIIYLQAGPLQKVPMERIEGGA